MVNFLKGMKKTMMLAGLACVVVGILILAISGFVADVIPWILGILLILFGLVEIVAVFVKPGKYVAVSRMVPGILALAVGLVFLLKDANARNTLLWTFVGLVILVDAIYKLQYAFELKAAQVKVWWSALLLALATLVLAIVVIVLDVKAATAVVTVSAIMIILNGVFDIAASAVFGVFGKDVSRAVTAVTEANAADNHPARQ